MRRAALLLALAALSTRAAAQDAPLPVPTPPAAVESDTPDVPLVLPYDEAERILAPRRQRRATTPPPPPATVSGAAAATSRTIRVEAPAVRNAAPHFVFEDVTDRSTPRTARTPAERAATVEAIRRGLAPAGVGR